MTLVACVCLRGSLGSGQSELGAVARWGVGIAGAIWWDVRCVLLANALVLCSFLLCGRLC